jgi:tRNA dimethylallyltransferase
VGKTQTSVLLAQHYECPVISADSRQVFKELSIGTAKPSPSEMQDVTHYFVNDRSLTADYSAGQFENEALKILTKEFKARDIVVLTGGSGLYVEALCEGMSDFPAVSDDLRASLKLELQEKGLAVLQAQLKKLDPGYYDQLDVDNPQRVVRALEVCLTSGKTFSELRVGASKKREFEVVYVGLELERASLYQRINQRMDLMIVAGLFEEAESVIDHKESNALQTIGYKEIYEYLAGTYDKEEAIRLLKRNSRRFAKRQLTWFKKNSSIKWFDPANLEGIINYIDKKLIIDEHK